ncbi:TEF transcription factor, PAR bZIP family member a isoform X2 [Brachyhypopomus gauderio]|uniref:TEF transcription factor, PAR bZIP family member a isoform X2 n=1 Tax=Brachyhypopomus gauderio TaxID=698409 RepID=UPI0040414479
MNYSEMSSDVPEILKGLFEYSSSPNCNDHESDKEKLSEDELDCEGVSGLGQSAALTPAIWEKTIPYDGRTFHLEYMDLEEFLMENGIPASEEIQQESSQQTPEGAPAVIPKAEPTPSPPESLLPVVELDQCEEEVITSTVSNSETTETKAGTTAEDRLTPDPIHPEDIEVEVNFDPDPTDLVLSSIPGGELFNPRKHRFTEEDLKPQPMIKKAKKTFVPEDKKDEKYWQRRNKNNIAAKRSRDARRLKENQITVRAAFLERENSALRQEVAELRKHFGRCKNIVARYLSKYGPL